MDADLSKKTPEEINVLLSNTAEKDKTALVKKLIKFAAQHKQREQTFRLLTELSPADLETLEESLDGDELSLLVKEYQNEIETLKKRIVITVHHLGGSIPLPETKNEKDRAHIIEAARDLRPEWYPTTAYNKSLDSLLNKQVLKN